MKKYILIIAITISILSCEKEKVGSKYIGTYSDAINTTVTVSQESNGILKFIWHPKIGTTATFDSVLVTSGGNVTDNENVFFGFVKKSVGLGQFLDNKLYFKFILNSMDIIEFNGTKR
jgi:hypothetical protein